MFEEKNYFTISELNGLIQQVVHMGFPQPVWVCGEIQGYDRSRTKKHVFFDLCEKDIETQNVIAKIGLVIFSGKKSFLEDVLSENGNPFELKDDIEVKFLCRVDFYPPHGAMRLVVESIDPSYTLGKIAAEKQRLIALLKKNGTLEKNKTAVFSLVPLRIGLVTSYDSAAYNDFLSELKISGFGFEVIYRNTLMQGKGAPEDVCSALGELYKRADCLDAIVITRGGGSIADLSCFDSARIAETISRSPVPVVTGIGHEVDVTITDLAAYVYHKTPTAVAKFFVSCVQDALERLESAAQDVFDKSGQYMMLKKNRLQNLVFDFHRDISDFLKDYDRRFVQIEHMLKGEPMRMIARKTEDLVLRKDALFNSLKRFLNNEHGRIEHGRRFIEASHPDNILKRGFSVTRRADGTLVRSVDDTHKGQTVMTYLSDGVFESVVKK